MIEITKGNGYFAVEGHAGYAEEGKDIVCASVSTLTQVFKASVEELITDKLIYTIRAGNAVVKYRDLSEQVQTLLNSFFIGVQMIADEYPEYVRIV